MVTQGTAGPQHRSPAGWRWALLQLGLLGAALRMPTHGAAAAWSPARAAPPAMNETSMATSPWLADFVLLDQTTLNGLAPLQAAPPVDAVAADGDAAAVAANTTADPGVWYDVPLQPPVRQWIFVLQHTHTAGGREPASRAVGAKAASMPSRASDAMHKAGAPANDDGAAAAAYRALTSWTTQWPSTSDGGLVLRLLLDVLLALAVLEAALLTALVGFALVATGPQQADAGADAMTRALAARVEDGLPAALADPAAIRRHRQRQRWLDRCRRWGSLGLFLVLRALWTPWLLALLPSDAARAVGLQTEALASTVVPLLVIVSLLRWGWPALCYGVPLLLHAARSQVTPAGSAKRGRWPWQTASPLLPPHLSWQPSDSSFSSPSLPSLPMLYVVIAVQSATFEVLEHTLAALVHRDSYARDRLHLLLSFEIDPAVPCAGAHDDAAAAWSASETCYRRLIARIGLAEMKRDTTRRQRGGTGLPKILHTAWLGARLTLIHGPPAGPAAAHSRALRTLQQLVAGAVALGPASPTVAALSPMTAVTSMPATGTPSLSPLPSLLTLRSLSADSDETLFPALPTPPPSSAAAWSSGTMPCVVLLSADVVPAAGALQAMAAAIADPSRGVAGVLGALRIHRQPLADADQVSAGLLSEGSACALQTLLTPAPAPAPPSLSTPASTAGKASTAIASSASASVSQPRDTSSPRLKPRLVMQMPHGTGAYAAAHAAPPLMVAWPAVAAVLAAYERAVLPHAAASRASEAIWRAHQTRHAPLPLLLRLLASAPAAAAWGRIALCPEAVAWRLPPPRRRASDSQDVVDPAELEEADRSCTRYTWMQRWQAQAQAGVLAPIAQTAGPMHDPATWTCGAAALQALLALLRLACGGGMGGVDLPLYYLLPAFARACVLAGPAAVPVGLALAVWLPMLLYVLARVHATGHHAVPPSWADPRRRRGGGSNHGGDGVHAWMAVGIGLPGSILLAPALRAVRLVLAAAAWDCRGVAGTPQRHQWAQSLRQTDLWGALTTTPPATLSPLPSRPPSRAPSSRASLRTGSSLAQARAQRPMRLQIPPRGVTLPAAALTPSSPSPSPCLSAASWRHAAASDSPLLPGAGAARTDRAAARYSTASAATALSSPWALSPLTFPEGPYGVAVDRGVAVGDLASVSLATPVGGGPCAGRADARDGDAATSLTDLDRGGVTLPPTPPALWSPSAPMMPMTPTMPMMPWSASNVGPEGAAASEARPRSSVVIVRTDQTGRIARTGSWRERRDRLARGMVLRNGAPPSLGPLVSPPGAAVATAVAAAASSSPRRTKRRPPKSRPRAADRPAAPRAS
ncbi:hypothetical protein CXG81DRAFT_23401 [Caulochytrium protostelioides]|uniref:Glycosyltransferase 2-like domain-containing protein n=1 Tax=Caulochytrium protostelioides TaxID=1555241 RepID=A0A4V1IVG6_9FUNG|nr:hypothetical protein CXG81DRAFT_23401 [Caulochytrium protostelioides]|eukprot:RKP03989.1 hypothetical protein CXG81DRAFT_23401 [Caulochytrium protostelioides]